MSGQETVKWNYTNKYPLEHEHPDLVTECRLEERINTVRKDLHEQASFLREHIEELSKTVARWPNAENINTVRKDLHEQASFLREHLESLDARLAKLEQGQRLYWDGSGGACYGCVHRGPETNGLHSCLLPRVGTLCPYPATTAAAPQQEPANQPIDATWTPQTCSACVFIAGRGDKEPCVSCMSSPSHFQRRDDSSDI